MTCQEARSILAAISVNEDRLQALQFVKRVLSDANTQEGVDNIVATFVYDEHKIIAAKILQTVISSCLYKKKQNALKCIMFKGCKSKWDPIRCWRTSRIFTTGCFIHKRTTEQSTHLWTNIEPS